MSRLLSFVANHLLKKSSKKLNDQDDKSPNLSRSSTIVPIMIGHTIAVHNGRGIYCMVIDQNAGHKPVNFQSHEHLKDTLKKR
jgi:small subunit ribosomal protein S19